MDRETDERLKALENEVYKLRDMIKEGEKSLFGDSIFIEGKEVRGR